MRTYKTTAIDLGHPTVITPVAAPQVSDGYSFIPTSSIVSALADTGWTYDSGTARKTRKKEDQAFTHHVLRFSHPSLEPLWDGTRPQAVIVNNHMGTGAFRICLGAFRMACANGLVIYAMDAGETRVRHIGVRLEDVVGVVNGMLLSAPATFRRINRWGEQTLSPSEALLLAQQCGRVRWPEPIEFAAEHLLVPRRREDSRHDLWTTFNTVQESIVKGGVRTRKTGEANERFAPAVRGALAQFHLNRSLWEVAESFAE